MDSVESAIAAKGAGAHRIELCSGLCIGGLTPTVGLLEAVKQSHVNLPIFVMIRPRAGDFLYSDHEFKVMKEDMLALKHSGVDGFVFGILKSDGTLDVERNRELIQIARPLPTTLHRAFDMTADLQQSLSEAISCGFSRILTSGGKQSVEEGASVVKTLVDAAGNNLIVMAGSGISEKNVTTVLRLTGCKEFHCSGKVDIPSQMAFKRPNVSMGVQTLPCEYTLTVSSVDRLGCILKNAQSL